MRRRIIMETWPGTKRTINTRKCEPETVAVAVIPAACRFASAGSACSSSCTVVPSLQADRAPLAGQMPEDQPGVIFSRGRRWEQALGESGTAENPGLVAKATQTVVPGQFSSPVQTQSVVLLCSCCSLPVMAPPLRAARTLLSFPNSSGGFSK